MIISLIIISLLSISGLSLTYLFSRDETFLWRLSAGNIVGSAVFGLVCFIIANLFGFNFGDNFSVARDFARPFVAFEKYGNKKSCEIGMAARQG